MYERLIALLIAIILCLGAVLYLQHQQLADQEAATRSLQAKQEASAAAYYTLLQWYDKALILVPVSAKESTILPSRDTMQHYYARRVSE